MLLKDLEREKENKSLNPLSKSDMCKPLWMGESIKFSSSPPPSKKE